MSIILLKGMEIYPIQIAQFPIWGKFSYTRKILNSNWEIPTHQLATRPIGDVFPGLRFLIFDEPFRDKWLGIGMFFNIATNNFKVQLADEMFSRTSSKYSLSQFPKDGFYEIHKYV